MKISFDFDGTLGDNDKIQKLLLLLKNTNCEIYLITARDINDKRNLTDMSFVYKYVKKENIHFTNLQKKSILIKQLGIDIHFDNDMLELEFIAEETNCLGLWLYEGDNFYFRNNQVD